MVNVKDLQKAYEETMSDRNKNIVNEFENFIDKQLIQTNGKSKLTKWDFLAIVDKAIGGLSTVDYTLYKEAFEYIEKGLSVFGHMPYNDGYLYTEEATLLRYMLKRYNNNGYLVKPSRSKTIYIER